MSQALGTAALLDSIGRFVSNVGVPATIAFFILYQLTPRLDAMNQSLTTLTTQMTVYTATCTSVARSIGSPGAPSAP